MSIDPTNYKDRQLILRCFLASGDVPPSNLVKLAPATFASILADRNASARDKIRAAEGIIKLQQLQLAAVGQVDKIKSRRQARMADQLNRGNSDGPTEMGKSIAELIQQLDDTQPEPTDE